MADKEYTVVYVGEVYITVQAEDENEAREKASEVRDSGAWYFKIRDSYVMGG